MRIPKSQGPTQNSGLRESFLKDVNLVTRRAGSGGHPRQRDQNKQRRGGEKRRVWVKKLQVGCSVLKCDGVRQGLGR